MCSKQQSLYCPYNPGSNGWNYSSTNYEILEKIIELASQKSYKDNLYSRIIEPLQFDKNSIFYDVNVNPAQIDNMVHGYYDDPNFPPFYGKDVTNISMSALRGAGGIIATSEALTKWNRLFFQGKVLSPSQFKKMTTVVCVGQDLLAGACAPGKVLTADDKNIGYSGGMFHVYDYYKSNDGFAWLYSGGTAGYIAASVYFIKQNLVISVIGDSVQDINNYYNLVQSLYRYLNQHSV